MSQFLTRFESRRQDWPTPRKLFRAIDAEFGFTLDAAASQDNTLVSGSFFDENDNALTQSWGSHVVWLNPPFGKQPLQVWVKKAFEESQSGATVVMLIPARTNNNWFHDYCLAKGEIRFLRGRPKFGDAEHGLPLPLCLVIFRPPAQLVPRQMSMFNREKPPPTQGEHHAEPSRHVG